CRANQRPRRRGGPRRDPSAAPLNRLRIAGGQRNTPSSSGSYSFPSAPESCSRGITQAPSGRVVAMTSPAIPTAGTAGNAVVPSEGAAAGPTILVVDDERNIRRTLELILQGEGYRVAEAASGEAALEILTNGDSPVELAIVDLLLPGMSGLELLERV